MEHRDAIDVMKINAQCDMLDVVIKGFGNGNEGEGGNPGGGLVFGPTLEGWDGRAVDGVGPLHISHGDGIVAYPIVLDNAEVFVFGDVVDSSIECKCSVGFSDVSS